MVEIRITIRKLLVVLSFVFAFMLFNSEVALAADCGGVVKCECGDTLIESQTMWYDLGAIAACPDKGIIIDAPNITLDCNNHIIYGDNLGSAASSTSAIYSIGLDNITIQNCNIDNFYYGVYVRGDVSNNITNINILNNTISLRVDDDAGIVAGYLENSLIENNTVINSIGLSNGISINYGHFITINANSLLNNSTGIIAVNFYDSNVIDNTIKNTTNNGIIIIGADRNLFDNNIFDNNGQGFYIIVANQNQFTNNEISNSSYSGLRIEASNSNDFWNNTFINNNPNAISRSSNSNYYIGMVGNFWDDFASNPGYPDYYVIDSGQNDMFPNVSNPDTYCGGLIPCGCGDTLYTDHTMDYDLTCNTLAGESAITIGRDLVDLNCDGHSISGVGNGNGILNKNSDSSISNCSISNFFWGINNLSISQTTEALESYPFLTKNIFEKPAILKENLGINKINSLAITSISASNTYTNNIIFDNTTEGLILSGDNHVVDGNIFYGNGNIGLYVKASNSQFLNNTSTDNYWIGILNNGDNNNYTTNELYLNQIGVFNFGNYNSYTTNELYSNDIGMKIFGDYNSFNLNNFYDNTEIGLEFINDVGGSTDNNTVWNNTFTNNAINATDEGIDNLFSTSTIGNFWDDLVLNPGYPSGQYIIPTNGVDYFPVSDYVDGDGDGYLFHITEDFEGEDCNDSNSNVNPGMPEIIFNRIDDNCDGRIDEHSKPRTRYIMMEAPLRDNRFLR